MKLDTCLINPSTSTDPLFLSISPFRTSALADGDFRLADSTAIITYFEALQPPPAVLLMAPRERARAIWFEGGGRHHLVPARAIGVPSTAWRPEIPRAGGRPRRCPAMRSICCCHWCTATSSSAGA